MSPQQNNSLFGNRNDTQARIKGKDIKEILRNLNTMSSREAKLLANDDLKSLAENGSVEDKAMALFHKAQKSRTLWGAYQGVTYSSIENKNDYELNEILKTNATAH